MTWFLDHWQLVLPLVLGALALWWLMPTAASRPRIVGALLGIAALALLAGNFAPAADARVESLMTAVFGVSAIASAVMMVTNRNPVYAALWFAVATLSVCGLFLMQSAPFLAAATAIVYAGAIIVTFLFVIMLAQQSGATAYDQRARQPFLASVTAFVLLGGLLFGLSKARPEALPPSPPSGDSVLDDRIVAAPDPPRPSIGAMRGLGSQLFGPYIYAVELAGTLLLIAAIGAIAIAPRRTQGQL
ncbi:MAG: NADH-quinone oxidoreductase subunit J [Planctomyces sp.]|nr:NADH-quinone oxidoreductase subunit J [Planctomyces sp.]